MTVIEVTDLESEKTETYEYSRNNWANRYACMRGSRVHMWAPLGVSENPIITGGRRWRIVSSPWPQ